MKKSVGIIPYRINDGVIEFFVGHPGGWLRNYWAYMKGGIEPGEDELSTALREFHEESGIDLSDYKDKLEYLGQTLQNPKKEVAAYGINLTGLLDIKPNECFSNLCEDGVTPEIDKYKWMTWNELKAVTHPKHNIFYETIIHRNHMDEDC